MKKHIVSFSGGKDSTAMLLMMLERKMRVDEVIYADTTLEFPEMYEYIDKIEKHIGIPIRRTTPLHDFFDWFYTKPKRGNNTDKIRGFPAVVLGCWWSRAAKIRPLTRAHGKGNRVYVGIAADEQHRSLAKHYKDQPNEYVFPLVEWGVTEFECQQYLDDRGLRNPLSDRFKRTGCWLCPKQSIGSLRSLYLHYPELWSRLRELDADAPRGFNHNFKLEDLESRFLMETLES